MKKTPLAERLWARVNKLGPIPAAMTNRCWEWLGACTAAGYGRIYSGDRPGHIIGAHRAAYIVAHGEIPAGLEIDHRCHNRKCVRPSHLEAVTRSVNIKRALDHNQRRKTHCPQGHEYTDQNTRRYYGRRACKTCYNAYMRRYKRRRKAAH